MPKAMKTEFNKYRFVTELFNEIKKEIENDNIDTEDGIDEYINSALDNAVIYYADCFDICRELNATRFDDWDMGEAKDICQLAYFALYEEVNSELERQELNEILEAKQNPIDEDEY